ncbi:hypothetical protein ABNQ39_15020 [Azospirillum sp. A26]|uniref:hypothetical protein n=1 Tax=Azospirillum sp. A26 TaxID=3160607 RepID=UPI00366D936C
METPSPQSKLIMLTVAEAAEISRMSQRWVRNQILDADAQDLERFIKSLRR